MNLLITGKSGSGKTTAIYRILQELQEPVYGFWTKKYYKNADGKAPVYLHDCRKQLCFCRNNMVGLCVDRGADCFPEVFDSAGVIALKDIPAGSIVLMDELGFMENDAKLFQKQVLDILNRNYRVIAAIKDRSTPFLDAVRSQSNVILKNVDETKTDEFYSYAKMILMK